jgi:peroxiredoxin (alkyl hydroperoxide reductase subunit C)
MSSHPADFTPVCTTEMSGFAERKSAFEAMNTELIGLSIDSIHTHLVWINNVHKNMGILFDFPIIANLDMKVSKLYRMLQPNESTTAVVRAVFFIDPKKKVRLIMYCPLNVGRNMDEILRALEALQVSDEYKVAMPLNWKKGEIIEEGNTPLLTPEEYHYDQHIEGVEDGGLFFIQLETADERIYQKVIITP